MVLGQNEQGRLDIAVGRVFTPAAPINAKSLFAGRFSQVRRVIDAINQTGQHTVIYGERGVGKTSLSNVLKEYLEEQRIGLPVLAPRVQCDGTYDYSKMWGRIFEELEILTERHDLRLPESIYKNADIRNGHIELSPDRVRKFLTLLAEDTLLIIIIDEFDRLTDDDTKTLLADTIKNLADNPIRATVVVVGVADSVDELIYEHESIERALVQVKMPRMNKEELREIVSKGLERLNPLKIEEGTLNQISLLSQGLPHYAHLLALHAARHAIKEKEETVSLTHVESALKSSTEDAQSVMGAYHKATMSSRKESLYAQVLQACALAPKDEFGYFSASDVRDPMSRIMEKEYGIPNFANHLNDFCVANRGEILQKTGVPRRYKYRFKNPLLQPYVLMKGLIEGKIDRGILEHYSTTISDS